jgi:hypothetical protein
MKQSHLTVKVSLMKTLWQQVITITWVEAKIKFGQDNNTLGISSGVYLFIVTLNGLKIQEVSHVNKGFQ